MKFQKFKNTVQLTCLIFTGIVILEAAFGQMFNNRMVWGILVCSALAALLKSCLFSDRLFEASILRQMGYLILVWILFLVYSFFAGRGLTSETAASILAEVLVIYFAIRLVNYQLVKMEAKRMNQRLEHSEKEKESKR